MNAKIENVRFDMESVSVSIRLTGEIQVIDLEIDYETLETLAASIDYVMSLNKRMNDNSLDIHSA